MKKLMLVVAMLPLLAACWCKKDECQKTTSTEMTQEETPKHEAVESAIAEESDDNVDNNNVLGEEK